MLADIRLFLSVVHAHTPEDALISLCRLPLNGPITSKWFLGKYRDSLLVEALEQIKTPINTYIRLTPVKEKPRKGRGLEADAMGSSVLWVDFDCYNNQVEGLERLKALPKPPTLIVNSGRGLQSYWGLKSFCTDTRAIKARNKKLAEDVDPQTGDSCYDLARILRVPGTYNTKTEPPILASILYHNPEAIYSLEDFEEAPLADTTIRVWDQEVISDDLLDEIEEKDKKLFARIASEELARKVGAPTTQDGGIDRSKNDYYIVNQLFKLGFSAGVALAVLTHPIWLSGSKYRATGRYDYVVTTVNSSLEVFEASEEQYFNTKNQFQPTRMAEKVTGDRAFLYANERLYRYAGGYFQPDGKEWVRAEVAKRLGPKWNSKYSSETVTYIEDTSRVDPDSLNNHRGMINVLNGMVSLETGQISPHNSEYLSLNQLPVEYNPKAESPELDAFVAAILPQSAIPVFWEYVGSSLLQDQYWPKAYMCLVGPGDTGKSKLLAWVFEFLGGKQNCSAIDLQTLADNRFAMAHLFGKYANVFSDLNPSEAKNIGQIKALTGDDQVMGEKKGKDGFFFKNTARLFFSANNFPPVRAPDEAFFNRSLILPCTRKFTKGSGERAADKDIMGKITSPMHFSAGLNRAIEGLKRLIAQNEFSHSPEIEEAQRAYRFTADTVAGFLANCTYVPGYRISKQAFYQQYVMICTQGHRHFFSDDKFFKRIAEIKEQFGLDEIFPQAEEGKPRIWYFVNLKPPVHLLTSISEIGVKP